MVERYAPAGKKPVIHYLLWTAQALLALLFLFAGGMKLVSPAETLSKQSTLPVLFMRFIGIAEVLGGLGLVLPGMLRTQARLTALAAVGLLLIMVGAVAITVATLGAAKAMLPFVVGSLLIWIAYSRWRVLPLAGK